MIAHIWMLTWLPQVLPAITKLPKPINVTLTSSHFSHMLKWEPGPGTPTGVYYHVTVTTDKRTSWVPVAGCERVQHPLVCNLTDAFSNPKEFYFTQVTAVLEAQTSQPFIHPGFQPIEDTHLDLPLLTVTSCGRDLCVDLQPPLEHLRDIYNSLHYKLRIKSNSVDRAQFFMDITSLRREILGDLASGRQYCVSVCFSDNLEVRKSNYSQPVCAFTPGFFTADPLISAMLCLLVMSGVVLVALLVHTGFICLKRPLPLVLTSSYNIEEALVIGPCSTTLSSLRLNLKPTLPSSGEKMSNPTLSDESDGESVTESTGNGGKGVGYKLQVGPNLLSSSSSPSSSSSLSTPISPEPEPLPSLSSNEISDFNPQPNAGLNHTLSTHIPESDQCASGPCPPVDTDSFTVGSTRPNEEEKEVVGEGDSQDVNLLTLTFGRHEEEEEEEKPQLDILEVEPQSSSASEVYNSTPILPSQTWNTKEVAIEMVSCFVDEQEEEEEHSGYMGRPCTDVLQNLL